MTEKRKGEGDKLLYCSFCGKSQHEVRKLIAGPSVYVCDECVELCNDIIREEIREISPKRDGSELPTPHEIRAHLDDYVIGQEYAKKVLAVAVYNHYKRLRSGSESGGVELGKSNILLIGPTGSGKTLLAETLARLLDVPFTMADATTLTEAGYVGEDVENIIQKLLQSATTTWRRPSVASSTSTRSTRSPASRTTLHHPRRLRGRGAAGTAETDRRHHRLRAAPGRSQAPAAGVLQVDTSKILFICGGAFAGLDKVIEQRSVKGTGIGFGAEVKSKNAKATLSENFAKVEPEDLIKYGLIPEFIGRLPVVATLTELDEAALIQILKEPKTR